MNNIKRCDWVTSDPLYIRYHDTEWGVPVHDDRKIFEFLILEGAQAGLSWLTILKRRQGYCNAFCEFDPEKVARFSEADIQKRLQDPGMMIGSVTVRISHSSPSSPSAVGSHSGLPNASSISPGQ